MHRRQGRRGPSALTVARRIRRAPAHRALLAFCLAVLVVLLAVQGIALQSTGAERGARGDGSSPLAGSAPVVSWSGSRLVALSQPPGRRIALTFDDGPDPRWTPAIEAVLRRYGATATFFEVGSAVVRHPGITRELRAHGFELGNHTFSHLNVARAAGWVRSWQLGLTENAITGAAGVSPRLMRFPYSSHASDVTAGQLPAVEDVARAGYLVVFCQYDTHDWERPGAASIVQAATPPAGSGGIVMMHDAGGDRSQTVAALARLLPSLKARGYSFVHVSDLVGLAPRAVAPAASGWQGARGWFLIVTLGVAAWVTAAVTFVVAPIAVLALLRALIVALIAGRQARRRRRPDTGFAPPLSIVVPAFNEAVGIERSVRSLAASDYPDFEIVVVDDGSSDGTAEIVEALELPRVRVIRQSNAGKPAAINAGATAARHEVIVCVDADTIF